MEFYTLASSSAGNAALLIAGGTTVLIDAGISARRIAQALHALGVEPAALDAVLITHEHSDHVKGLATLTKHWRGPVYASRGTARCLPCAPEQRCAFSSGDAFDLGALRVQSFRTSHDATDSVGYRFDCEEGSLGILTDTGFVTEEAEQVLDGAELLLLEANHDVDMLRGGPYPYYLKERILGPRGHLSNDAAAEFAVRCAERGTRDVVLAHLSAENNTPVLAEYTVARALQRGGYDVHLGVAPRDAVGARHICARTRR